jgi:hypothetical protein
MRTTQQLAVSIEHEEVLQALELVEQVLEGACLWLRHPGVRPHLISARVQLHAAAALLSREWPVASG